MYFNIYVLKYVQQKFYLFHLIYYIYISLFVYTFIIKYIYKLTIRYMWSTQKERISGITRRTATHWNVINNVAACITTACAWARIYTVLINASSGTRTIWIHCAFWPTIRVRIPEVVRQTSAYTFVAFCVRPTRWRITQIFGNYWLFCNINFSRL